MIVHSAQIVHLKGSDQPTAQPTSESEESYDDDEFEPDDEDGEFVDMMLAEAADGLESIESTANQAAAILATIEAEFGSSQSAASDADSQTHQSAGSNAAYDILERAQQGRPESLARQMAQRATNPSQTDLDLDLSADLIRRVSSSGMPIDPSAAVAWPVCASPESPDAIPARPDGLFAWKAPQTEGSYLT